MSTIVGIKAINRTTRVRIGNHQLSTDEITYVDLEDPRVMRSLSHHSAVGQWMVVQGRQTVYAQQDMPDDFRHGDIWLEVDGNNQLIAVWTNDT